MKIDKHIFDQFAYYLMKYAFYMHNILLYSHHLEFLNVVLPIKHLLYYLNPCCPFTLSVASSATSTPHTHYL